MPKSQTNRNHPDLAQPNLAWDTLLAPHPAGEGRGPLHDRLAATLRATIRTGRLPTGSALPPSRKLAADLGCSRWVVTQAYAQLGAEGYLEARTGSATRVRWTGDPNAGGHAPQASAPQPRPRPRFDLAPGLPDLRAFPRRRWIEAVRAELTAAEFTDLGYPAQGGQPRLRAVLAEYLRRCRGAVAEPADLTVCAGVTDGLSRACRALRLAGLTTIAVEDPSLPRLREAAEWAGLRTVPVRVDGSGLVVAALDTHPEVRAVLVTPAHQFPTGTVLAPQRRADLVAWARHVDGVVLEDDYDAEFRYDRRPMAAVQGMDPAHVILLGSLSKTLSPALGIGWIVTPPRWTEHLRAAGDMVTGPPAIDQLAFARLVESGGYDRHLRSARQRYRARRDALVRALAERLPGCGVSGAAAGLHLLVHLADGVDPAEVVRRAAATEVRVAALDSYRVRPGPGPGPGPGPDAGRALVLGYGNLADAMLAEAVYRLAGAVLAASE